MMKKLTSHKKKKRPLVKIREELDMYEKRLLRLDDEYAAGKMDAEIFAKMCSRYNLEIDK